MFYWCFTWLTESVYISDCMALKCTHSPTSYSTRPRPRSRLVRLTQMSPTLTRNRHRCHSSCCQWCYSTYGCQSVCNHNNVYLISQFVRTLYLKLFIGMRWRQACIRFWPSDCTVENESVDKCRNMTWHRRNEMLFFSIFHFGCS